MSIIDDKIIFITAVAVLYAVAWMLKPQTILRSIITFMLGVMAVLWVADFFGLYPFGDLAKEVLADVIEKFDSK